MLLDRKSISVDSNRPNQIDGARAFCEMIPGAVSLWGHNRSFRLFNDSAKRLINYSEVDFLKHPSLWLERIHSDDRQKFCRSVETLVKGKSVARCDYRFFPGNASEPIWIREHSLSEPTQKKVPWNIVSVYTDISDLKTTHTRETKKDVVEIPRVLIHDFQNCVQKVGMELELAQMDLKRNFSISEVASAMDSMNRSLQDLRDQLVRVLNGRISQNPLSILDGDSTGVSAANRVSQS
jgi:PAS fold